MRPQSLIALSALLLSLCGLFISIYEASLIRKAQHAAAWPHVEVAASLGQEGVDLWVRNTGIGPARVRALAVSYQDETLTGWGDLARRVLGKAVGGVGDAYQSMVGGTVLPADGTAESIFAVTAERGAEQGSIDRLRDEIVAGSVDILLCYCSVYDECWTSTLQSSIKRWRGTKPVGGARPVDDCDQAPRSAI